MPIFLPRGYTARGPGAAFFEFETDDLEATRRELLDGGCELTPATTSEGDDSYLVADPYGLRFHVYEP